VALATARLSPVDRGLCHELVCGVVRWSYDAAFTTMLHCHCSICRKQHGTLFATFLANRFWEMQPPQRFMVENSFFEHLGLIGGFLLIAWLDLGDTDPIPGIADDHNGRVIIRAGNRLVRVATGATRRTGTVPLRTRWQPTPADRRV
jgi:hypothetical protein